MSSWSGQCRRLRTKSMFHDVEQDTALPPMNDGFFWCTHTQNCLGPDGKVAGRDDCNRGRPCFEP
jgi:hypothetical protein